MKKGKRALKAILIVITIIAGFILLCYVNHRIQLRRERELRQPLGQMVEVNGARTSVYVEGSGPETLVFLSGGGTFTEPCSTTEPQP